MLLLRVAALLIIGTSLVYSNTSLREVLIEYRTPNENGVVLGIQSPTPRISWSLSTKYVDALYQTQYRIRCLDVLAKELVWDSGIVESEQTLHVLYKGDALNSDTRYRVFVEVWTTTGVSQSLSTDFHTGLFESDAFNGIWIGSNTINMNELRKEFLIPGSIAQATVFISGLGYYELFINGKNVDPTRKLDPGWTTYEVRVLYSTFDVTSMLKTGTNAAGILLGNGWYSQEQNIWPSTSRPTYGPPKVILQLNIKLTNGTNMSVVSDKSWMGRTGAITFDSVYLGENVDGRLIRPGWSEVGFVDPLSAWINAEAVAAPTGIMTAQMMEPIRTQMELKPVWLHNPNLNIWLADFGQNFAGWVRVNVTGPKGTTIRIRYAEILEQTPSRSIYSEMIYQDNLRAAIQTDEYTLNGNSPHETFEPHFTYHGFRYAEFSNLWNHPNTADIVGVVVHSTTPPAGNFKSNNPVLNQIHTNIIWGQQSNLMSLPTDCNQRDERKGWMGDAALTVDEALFNFKLAPFYQNWAQNIRDAQQPDGSVPDTVPHTFGAYPADPNWGTAYPTTIYAMYDHYGDTQFVMDHYNNIKMWVDYLTQRVAKSGLGKMYFNYGDWVPPPPHPRTNESLTSAASYAIDARNLAKLARELNKPADQQKYEALYVQIGAEFHKAFWNPSVNGYADGSQTANVLAFTIDAVPQNLTSVVKQSLLSNIQQNNNHLTTGIIGTRWLFDVLTHLDAHNVALAIATQTTYPSYGYMFTNPYENATTLWELWDAPFEGPGMNSRNHIMFGSIDSWFYRSLAGIKPNALKEIEISPGPISTDNLISEVEASYDTMKGLVGVHWKKTEHAYFMSSVIPPGTTGKLVLPYHDKPYTLLHLGETVLELSSLNNRVAEIHTNGIETVTLLDNGSIQVKVLAGAHKLQAVL